MAGVAELGISLLSSAIAGLAVTLFSRLRRRRQIERLRAFFGVQPGSRPLIIVSQHHGIASQTSVHLHDAAGVVEMAALAMRCGGEPDLVGQHQAPPSLGSVTEICVGGPNSSTRVATHLRLLLPGVTFADGPGSTITAGGQRYTAGGDLTHVVLAKVYGPQGGAPVFLISGQEAADNRAGARYLTRHHHELMRRYGSKGQFAVVLRLRGVVQYGNDAVDHATHITATAFAGPADTDGAPTDAESAPPAVP